MKLKVRFFWTVSPSPNCHQQLFASINDAPVKQLGKDFDGDTAEATVEMKEGIHVKAWIRTMNDAGLCADSNHDEFDVSLPISLDNTPEPATGFGHEIGEIVEQ